MDIAASPQREAPDFGPALMERLDAFARFSDDPEGLCRLYLSPAHRAAADALSSWMAEAGMEVRIDAAGTVVGRYEGEGQGLPALLLGSHIDTVRKAGRYDGNLGVLAAVAAVAELNRRGERFPFAIEVLGFGDEEGVRFPTTLTGSRAVAGTLEAGVLAVRDAGGVTLAGALRGFGVDPDGILREARRPGDVLAFVELHIEQGPVLEAEGLPLGVVTAISGASRAFVTVSGTAGHAGTVPMDLRRDALAAAAEMVLGIERLAAGNAAGLVATVGRIEAGPGAVNVIPGRAGFSVDIRAPDDGVREAGVREMERLVAAVAARRQVSASIEHTHDAKATRCDPALADRLEASLRRLGLPARRLPSGAGHDAMAVAPLVPVGMLFVRCRGGISHNPAESITAEDAGLGVRALLDFIRHFDGRP